MITYLQSGFIAMRQCLSSVYTICFIECYHSPPNDIDPTESLVTICITR